MVPISQAATSIARRPIRWVAPSMPPVVTLTWRSQGSGTERALSVNAPRWISTTISTARAARAAAIATWPAWRIVTLMPAASSA